MPEVPPGYELGREGTELSQLPGTGSHPPFPHHPLPTLPHQDYRLRIGITYIEMNVGNVKEVDRRGFDLTTPYRIFR